MARRGVALAFFVIRGLERRGKANQEGQEEPESQNSVP